MAVEKSLYQAPTGVEEEIKDQLGEPDLEIEIEDPEKVTIRAGDMEMVIDPDAEDEDDFNKNIADDLNGDELELLGSDLIEEIKSDLGSRKDWEQTYKEGITLLGLKYEERSEPWSGASGVFHPMITEAVVRFQSETIMETFPAQGPVKTKIIGKDSAEKDAAARRVKEDLNYELTERMPEFRTEHERMLWNLPATGSAFKKVYFDPSLQRQTSLFIPAEDIIISYGASSIETAERITHRMYKTSNEIRKLQVAGFYRDIELGDPPKIKDDLQEKKDQETGFSSVNDDRYVLYESHVNLDLIGFEDEDEGKPTGIAIPYVVTLVEGTGEILAIRRNYYEDDKTKAKRNHFVHYMYIPGYGVYGFGLFHLIGGFAKSATSIMRQLVDAGTLANLPGGLKARGLRIKGDDTPIAPGEFRDVDVSSGAIRDNILPLPYKEPSGVLYQLLGTIVEEGRRFASTADMKISDMSGQAPVGTTLALLERMLKVMSAVQARVHYSFKQELQLLATIIRDYSDEEYTYDPKGAPRQAKKEDYDEVEIIPVSDPNAATMSQRVVQYQAVIQLAQGAPQIYDLPQLHRQMLEVLGIKNAAKLVPVEGDYKPRDPVSENMDILNGKPVKAFIYQDHEAHIIVHTTAMQDPKIRQIIGQNPKANQIMGVMQAHIAEHVAFAYRNKIEEQLGIPLPPPDEDMPEELELQISRLAAEAGKRLLTNNQKEAAQQQAQQQAQDPIVQMQQQELALKKAEFELKKQKMMTDAATTAEQLKLKEKEFLAGTAARADELKLKEKELLTEAAAKADELKLKEKEILTEAAAKADELKLKGEIEGVKVGVDIGKAKDNLRQRTLK